MSHDSNLSEILLWALIEMTEKSVRNALRAGANANQSSPTGSSPLHVAALRGSPSIITTLLEHGAELDQADSEGYTPLMVATLNGKEDAVSALLACGADPELTRLDTGETALHLAMNGGSPGVVRALLEAGANVNAQTIEEKFTPLHFAAEFGSKNLAIVLLSNWCEAEAKDSKGRTASEVAREKGHHGLAEHLDLYTAAKTVPDKQLVSAIMKLQEQATRQALTAGANANISSRAGSRPLHAASLRGSAPIITTLVEYRAKVDQGDFEGYTPLMVAALNGRADAVSALLACGADPWRTRLGTGETALHLAMNGGSPGVVRSLKEAGANVNAQTTEGMTPLDYAEQYGATDLAKILEDNLLCNPGVWPREDTIQVIYPEKPVPPRKNVYKVMSEPRGRVLLLTYEEACNEDDREGAAKDTQRLKYIFEEMGYHVTTELNQNKEDTNLALASFRDSEKLGEVDCAVVCVLSHGKKPDIFMTSCGGLMTVDEVYDFFTDEQCPALRGKPKLFLFNFCRGEYIEKGCIVDDNRKPRCEWLNISSSEKRAVPDYQEPRVESVLNDCITLFASVEGVKATRTREEGTRFVQAIERTFASSAHSLDVVELADEANRRHIPVLQGTLIECSSVSRKKFFLNPTQPPRHSTGH